MSTFCTWLILLKLYFFNGSIIITDEIFKKNIINTKKQKLYLSVCRLPLLTRTHHWNCFSGWPWLETFIFWLGLRLSRHFTISEFTILGVLKYGTNFWFRRIWWTTFTSVPWHCLLQLHGLLRLDSYCKSLGA